MSDDKTFVIVAGDLRDGIEVYGPYPTEVDAWDSTDSFVSCHGSFATVVELITPEEDDDPWPE